ncbi:MAG: (Fe-S)-binding protein, partial [Bacteroidia bacterium]|nr:(Fe-S)-binding protein [Bacteroidia bacterium]
MPFNPFVIPFTAGLFFLVSLVFIKFIIWLKRLTPKDKFRIKKGIFTIKSFYAIKEVFLDSLLHRKIFRVNPILGYMHMSLAFGWFLLIITGNLESRLHSGSDLNPPYYPIFFKFFIHDRTGIPLEWLFSLLMDLFLLMVLSGVVLAILKRLYSTFFGMRRTSRLKPIDFLAMLSLWFIFPLRLFAESFTSGIYDTGNFLTGSLGNILVAFLPAEELSYVFWWAYSISLCTFFIALPYSRYTHIPTEVLLIFLRNYGIRNKREYSSFSDIEVFSCPKCGICIDKCQLGFAGKIHDVQTIYFIQAV